MEEIRALPFAPGKKLLLEVVKQLGPGKKLRPFELPVVAVHPGIRVDYEKRISYPMDLSTMRSKSNSVRGCFRAATVAELPRTDVLLLCATVPVNVWLLGVAVCELWEFHSRHARHIRQRYHVQRRDVRHWKARGRAEARVRPKAGGDGAGCQRPHPAAHDR